VADGHELDPQLSSAFWRGECGIRLIHRPVAVVAGGVAVALPEPAMAGVHQIDVGRLTKRYVREGCALRLGASACRRVSVASAASAARAANRFQVGGGLECGGGVQEQVKARQTGRHEVRGVSGRNSSFDMLARP
jgi:hypothetical protein